MRSPARLSMAYDDPDSYDENDDDVLDEDEDEEDEEGDDEEETWQVGSGELRGLLDFWEVKIEDCAVFGQKAETTASR